MVSSLNIYLCVCHFRRFKHAVLLSDVSHTVVLNYYCCVTFSYINSVKSVKSSWTEPQKNSTFPFHNFFHLTKKRFNWQRTEQTTLHMAQCMDINNNNKKINANSLSKYIKAYRHFGVARDKCAPAVRRSRSIPAIFPRFKVIAMVRKCRKHNVRDENTFLQIHHQNAKVPRLASWTFFFRRSNSQTKEVRFRHLQEWSVKRLKKQSIRVLSNRPNLLTHFDFVLLP